jgi:hemoglobin
MPRRARAPLTSEPILTALGDADGVAATVDDLYARLLDDPTVAPYFQGIDIERIKVHMTDFLVTVLDGPDRYQGRQLARAHAPLSITDEAFDSTAAHLLDALEARAVRPEVLDLVLDRVAPLRSAVVTR